MTGQFGNNNQPMNTGYGFYSPYPYRNQPSYPQNGPQFDPHMYYGMIPVQYKNIRYKLRVWLISIIGAIAIIILSLVLFGVAGGYDSDNINTDSSENKTDQLVNDGIISAAPSAGPDINGPQISAVETPDDDSAETAVANKVYDKTAPSIVCITSYEGGKDYTLDAIAEGSGIILTQNGYIATNSHVVDDSTKTGVMVTLYDNTQYLGTIIGVDSRTDIAVIKIDAQNLQPAEFADSDKIKIGQQAFAMGNPGGSEFANSLTKGAVSAINRILSGAYVRYIQTDAAINPGNSGGALINEYGQVIGMNTAKLAAVEFEGMGFAIPSNTVISIVNKLIKYGYVNDRAALGIECKTCTLYMSKANNVPQGVRISKINSDSPISKTDAEVNDIITALNGVTVTSTIELTEQLSKYKPDDTITLTLYRPAEKNSKSYSFDISVKLISNK